MACRRKHTKVQIPDDEWACPKCGAGSNGARNEDGDNMGFIVDTDVSAEMDMPDDMEECPLLHEDDECNCYNCGAGYSGKRLVTIYIKKKNLVPCPCCSGKGVIPSDNAEELSKKLKIRAG